VLQSSRRARITVREELETVRSYLALVGLHFDDRLTVRESIDPHVLDNEIPSMVLQLL
jgi:LytS/YehU family sensor histidine kinase